MEYLSNGDVLRKRAVMFNDLSPIQEFMRIVCIIDNLVSRMIEAGFIKTSVDSPDEPGRLYNTDQTLSLSV